MKGRIALFITDLTGGGAERVMVNLAAGIVAKGYQVDFLVAKRVGVYFDYLPSEVNVVDLACRSAMLSGPKVAEYLKRNRPLALISALNQPNTMAVLAKKLARVPTRIGITVHNTLEEQAKSDNNRLMPIIARAFYPSADEIICISAASADSNAKFLRIPRSRIKLILNPVITPQLHKTASETVDHPWFAPGQPPVILGVGRLAKQKNFEMLIDAVAEVRKTTKARLMVLGEGEDREQLEARAKAAGFGEDIEMPGFVSNPFKYLKAARLFALSSIYEGLPTVLIESLGVGTPVVSTDCPSGPQEILKGGKYGLLAPVGDVKAFAAALKQELDKPKQAPSSESYAPYELETVTDQYLEVMLGSAAK